MSSIKIAVGQLCSSSSLRANARVVNKLIDRAIEAKAKVLFLPEATDYLSRDARHSVELAQHTHSEFIAEIQQKISSVDDFCVAVGVHEPASGENVDKKVCNNQIWIDGKGIQQRYQKIHLFDINITNGPILKESNSVEPGTQLLPPFAVSAKFPQFKVGFSICYDIRFPELATRLRQLGANILTYPSAFTTRTGEAHWKELGRARAIDSQCYVVMAAQCGEHDVYADLEGKEKNEVENRKKRESYGQSLIIGPWGEVLAEAQKYSDDRESDSDGDYYELIVADLDLDHLEKIRTDLPVFSHRKPELYK